MELYGARALQVSMLTHNQLEELQSREKLQGSYLPNWNVQRLFHLGTIKDKYNIPKEDLGAQADYSERIEEMIKSMGLLSGDGGGFIGSGDLEIIHAFDWRIFNNLNLLNFDAEPSSQSVRRRRLKDIASE